MIDLYSFMNSNTYNKLVYLLGDIEKAYKLVSSIEKGKQIFVFNNRNLFQNEQTKICDILRSTYGESIQTKYDTFDHPNYDISKLLIIKYEIDCKIDYVKEYVSGYMIRIRIPYHDAEYIKPCGSVLWITDDYNGELDICSPVIINNFQYMHNFNLYLSSMEKSRLRICSNIYLPKELNNIISSYI